ncbi:MAG: hypothetical protein Kow0090_08800 [Myxococcota bacterium]
MVREMSHRVRRLREEAGYSQEYIAGKLGISRVTYGQIERGERPLTVPELELLAGIYNVDMGFFWGRGERGSKISVSLPKKAIKKKETQEIRIDVPQRRVDKFKEVLLYILNKAGARPNVGETVIYKLLYFIDFDFYEKYEEQLMGALYIKNHHGPTPVEFKAIVKRMEEEGELERVKSKYYEYEQTKYLPRKSPDLSLLSGLEIKHIDETLDRLAHLNASELSDLSHKDVPWMIAENGTPISYESVFYRDEQTSVRHYDDEL